MSDTATDVELTIDKLDDYLAAASSVVEELRDFLASHHADLVHCAIPLHGTGASMEMPQASQDPQHAGRVHNLKMACDNFINTMRGNLLLAESARPKALRYGKAVQAWTYCRRMALKPSPENR
jgi:hypothetical protein